MDNRGSENVTQKNAPFTASRDPPPVQTATPVGTSPPECHLPSEKPAVKSNSKRDQAIPKDSLFFIRCDNIFHTISKNYSYKTETYYSILSYELEGRPVLPSSRVILDAYVVPLCLERAKRGGIPVCDWGISQGYVPLPVILNGLNYFATTSDFFVVNDNTRAKQVIRPYRQQYERAVQGIDILCEEWVNSNGLIIRFSRNCLEIKALDEQECIRSDMAVCALVRSLLRCPLLPIETDQSALLALTETAIRSGTAEPRLELQQLYDTAWDHATDDERRYLPIIRQRIGQGSLAELVSRRYKKEQDIIPVLEDLAMCLKKQFFLECYLTFFTFVKTLIT
jgi:hypothetical protein